MFGRKKEQPKEKVQVDERLKHIAFIMDGNGRWAKKRGMPREYGHSVGAANFKKIGRYCESIGMQCMTVYAFSTENWKRPEHEVQALLKLFDQYIDDSFVELKDDRIHLRFIGNLSVFPQALREKMDRIDKQTSNRPFILNIAVNYGGREEITHACNELIKLGKKEVTEQDICDHIYTADCPDPDLIVRTGGDIRTSNFLLWQSAYAEYIFTETLWPDLSFEEIDEIVRTFYSRSRRYGGV